eukprot:TRINITY_DN8773_c0_g1_i3.p1 TRINITY_DN8773_c0_g1~~TRINITY_DN8773_c0_g1_i3.p1  ORF type:complete len:947 (-),score=246.59 TRINITY_DN8773_c0_g1_i3:246-3086(-)
MRSLIPVHNGKAEATPLLKEDSVDEASPSSPVPVAASYSNGAKKSSSTARGAPALGSIPVVQFARDTEYVLEASYVMVQVLRFGDLSQASTVRFYTKDASAKAPGKYVASEGTLKFEKGEEIAHIKIGLVQDDSFDTNLDFTVCLEKPQNCALGYNLEKCKVMICDDDIFPTNVYRQEILNDNMEAIGLRLLWHFVLFCLQRVPDVKSRAIKTVMLDQLHNLNYFWQLTLQVYMVNTVFAISDPTALDRMFVPEKYGGRVTMAVLVAVAVALPKIVLVWSEYYQIDKLGCAGNIRLFLKVNLFRKFLFYSSESHDAVSPQALHNAMLDEINEVTGKGFMIFFRVLKQLGKSGIILFFLFKKSPSSVLPVLIYPVAMAYFLETRYKTTLELRKKVEHSEVSSLTTFDRAVADINVLRNFGRRSKMVRNFEDTVKGQASPLKNFNLFEFNTEEAMPIITTLTVFLYMVWGGYFVIKPKDDPAHLSLGVFLATLHIYKDTGQLFSIFYLDIKEVYGVVGPLRKLINLLNKESEITYHLQQQDFVRKCRDQELEQMGPPRAWWRPNESVEPNKPWLRASPSRFDKLQVAMQNVPLRHRRGGPTHQALQNITLRQEQGKMTAIVGRHCTGKRTMLGMLKGSVVPDSGHIYFPAHLALLEVGLVPELVLEEGLLGNLTFGREWAKPARVMKICERVGLNKHVLELIETDIAKLDEAKKNDGKPPKPTSKHVTPREAERMNQGKWYEYLSHSEIIKITIARAFIFGPEVLVMHKPLDAFEVAEASRILQLLREYVDLRGLEMTPEDAAVQRPHSIFISTNEDRERKDAIVDICDSVWTLSAEGMTVVENKDPQHKPEKNDGSRITRSWHAEAQAAKAEAQRTRVESEGHMAKAQELQTNKEELLKHTSELKSKMEATTKEVEHHRGRADKLDRLRRIEASRMFKIRMCGGDLA